MIPYTDHNGKPATMSVEEFTCVPATHSHRAYAYGTPDPYNSRQRTIRGLTARVSDYTLGDILRCSWKGVEDERRALGIYRDHKPYKRYPEKRAAGVWKMGRSKNFRLLDHARAYFTWTWEEEEVLMKCATPLEAALKLKRSVSSCYKRGCLNGVW